MFAVFDTSMGGFTCRLDYVEVPMIVANFVGLAEGSRTWLDLEAGQIRGDPFYDGLAFHRVVAGFVIQAGSPAGDGSDGPGYTFLDQFHPALNHNQTGTLSMANSGYGSNGSQFFLTLDTTQSTTNLNNHHSVFGEVVEGLDVVVQIGGVAVDSNSKPLTNVVINSLTILRCGPEAEAFDVTAHGLPVVEPVKIELVRIGSDLELAFPREIYSEYLLYHSPDIASWTNDEIGLYFDPPPTGNVDITGTTLLSDVRVYVVPGIDYEGPLFTPATNAEGTFVLDIPTFGTMTHFYDAFGTGTYTWPLGSGFITSSFWVQDPYRAVLVTFYTGTAPWQSSLVFLSPTSGVYNATVFPNPPALPFKILGTFTATFP